MADIEGTQGTPVIRHARGRVLACAPLDQRRCEPLKNKAAVMGNTNLPAQMSSGHGLDLAQRLACLAAYAHDVTAAGYPSREPWRGVVLVVQIEPSGTLRRFRLGIGRNYFQVHGVAKSEQEVVRGHPRVFTTGNGAKAKTRLYEIRPFA